MATISALHYVDAMHVGCGQGAERAWESGRESSDIPNYKRIVCCQLKIETMHAEWESESSDMQSHMICLVLVRDTKTA